jgi:hypothetical protein
MLLAALVPVGTRLVVHYQLSEIWLKNNAVCVTCLLPISFHINDEDAKPVRYTVDGNSIALEHLHTNEKAAAPQTRRPRAYLHRQ